jgi:hypothetical protein
MPVHVIILADAWGLEFELSRKVAKNARKTSKGFYFAAFAALRANPSSLPWVPLASQ